MQFHLFLFRFEMWSYCSDTLHQALTKKNIKIPTQKAFWVLTSFSMDKVGGFSKLYKDSITLHMTSEGLGGFKHARTLGARAPSLRAEF